MRSGAPYSENTERINQPPAGYKPHTKDVAAARTQENPNPEGIGFIFFVLY
jgi:hypothetical protein